MKMKEDIYLLAFMAYIPFTMDQGSYLDTCGYEDSIGGNGVIGITPKIPISQGEI